MNKYLAVDLDGTLLNDKGFVGNSTKNTLNSYMKSGIIEKLIFASGRHYNNIKSILSEFENAENIIVICSDGQYIYENGRLLYAFRSFVQTECVQTVLGEYGVKSIYIVTDEKDYMIFTSWGKMAVCKIRNKLKQGNRMQVLNQHRTGKMKIAGNIEKLIVYSKNIEKLKYLNHGQGYYTHFLKDGTAEILCVNKYMALSYLDETGKIDLKETVYAGDDGNDIECFEYLDNCVAMGNAADQIKRIASYITASNNEEGIIKATARFFVFASTGKEGCVK